jgi:predicted acetyltransferase
MAKLLKPALERKHAFLRMAQDWRSHAEDRYALALEDFEAYLARARRSEDPQQVPRGRVPGSEFWLEEAEEIVACVRLRFWLLPALELEGGHIGYDVCPSARGRGFGTLALRLVLAEARCRGLQRVLLTADVDNAPSLKIIEKNGGVLSGQTVSAERGKLINQYWIDLPG